MRVVFVVLVLTSTAHFDFCIFGCSYSHCSSLIVIISMQDPGFSLLFIFRFFAFCFIYSVSFHIHKLTISSKRLSSHLCLCNETPKKTFYEKDDHSVLTVSLRNEGLRKFPFSFYLFIRKRLKTSTAKLIMCKIHSSFCRTATKALPQPFRVLLRCCRWLLYTMPLSSSFISALQERQ